MGLEICSDAVTPSNTGLWSRHIHVTYVRPLDRDADDALAAVEHIRQFPFPRDIDLRHHVDAHWIAAHDVDHLVLSIFTLPTTRLRGSSGTDDRSCWCAVGS